MTDTNMSLFGVIKFYSYVSNFLHRGWVFLVGDGERWHRQAPNFQKGWTFFLKRVGSGIYFLHMYVSIYLG